MSNRLSQEQKQFAIDNYYNMSNKDIASHIGCNPSHVSHVCKLAGLSSKKTKSKFSEEDIQYAVDNYHH